MLVHGLSIGQKNFPTSRARNVVLFIMLLLIYFISLGSIMALIICHDLYATVL